VISLAAAHFPLPNFEECVSVDAVYTTFETAPKEMFAGIHVR
jgi:hypothetical protein